MYSCRECERPINQATELCPYCGADLTETAAQGKAETAKESSTWKRILWLSIPLAAMWAFLWYVVPEKGSSQAADAESKAMAALREVNASLAAYAEAQGQFPASLEQLGDKVRSAAQRAQTEGYRLGYFPGPAGGDGRLQTYALVARPGNYGFRNFYMDQSGIMRSTREDRQATAEDPPI